MNRIDRYHEYHEAPQDSLDLLLESIILPGNFLIEEWTLPNCLFRSLLHIQSHKKARKVTWLSHREYLHPNAWLYLMEFQEYNQGTEDYFFWHWHKTAPLLPSRELSINIDVSGSFICLSGTFILEIHADQLRLRRVVSSCNKGILFKQIEVSMMINITYIKIRKCC